MYERPKYRRPTDQPGPLTARQVAVAVFVGCFLALVLWRATAGPWDLPGPRVRTYQPAAYGPPGDGGHQEKNR